MVVVGREQYRLHEDLMMQSGSATLYRDLSNFLISPTYTNTQLPNRNQIVSHTEMVPTMSQHLLSWCGDRLGSWR